MCFFCVFLNVFIFRLHLTRCSSLVGFSAGSYESDASSLEDKDRLSLPMDFHVSPRVGDFWQVIDYRYWHIEAETIWLPFCIANDIF